MSGEAWEKSRRLLAKSYCDLGLVSITGRRGRGDVVLCGHGYGMMLGAGIATQIRCLVASKNMRRLEDGAAVFGMAVDWPARTDRAAVSASTGSDFPGDSTGAPVASVHFEHLVPGSPDRASESRPVAAGALDAERGDAAVTLGPGDQLLVAV